MEVVDFEILKFLLKSLHVCRIPHLMAQMVPRGQIYRDLVTSTSEFTQMMLCYAILWKGGVHPTRAGVPRVLKVRQR